MSGLHHDPNLEDPAETAVHRAITAIKAALLAEFEDDEYGPNVTVVASVPPDGRVGIATTEPSPEDTLLALQMGWGAVHRAVRIAGADD